MARKKRKYTITKAILDVRVSEMGIDSAYCSLKRQHKYFYQWVVARTNKDAIQNFIKYGDNNSIFILRIAVGLRDFDKKFYSQTIFTRLQFFSKANHDELFLEIIKDAVNCSPFKELFDKIK